MNLNKLSLNIVKRSCFTILLIPLTLICAMNLSAQDETCNLLNKKITMQISEGTFVYVLATLAQDYEISIGWEKSSKHLDEPKININVKEKNLREVLDLLVAQEPEYKWELTNEVLNFTPSRNRDEFVSAFLNLHIDQIKHPKENTEDSLIDNILALPEVILLMKSKRIKYAEYMSEPSSQPMFSKEQADLTTSDTTIRNFFNKVIRDSDRKTWVVEMVGKNKDKLLISF